MAKQGGRTAIALIEIPAPIPFAIKPPIKESPRRIAISLELDWGNKRHLEVDAGCQKHADEAGWQCSINPTPERMLSKVFARVEVVSPFRFREAHQRVFPVRIQADRAGNRGEISGASQIVDSFHFTALIQS